MAGRLGALNQKFYLELFQNFPYTHLESKQLFACSWLFIGTAGVFADNYVLQHEDYALYRLQCSVNIKPALEISE
ncbi:hypothetical protein GUJ93_ZPchr0207g7163 [Zizania palustris]|uniref:Uncharacterized protein n=1 Tax=Zizania palustris TaxID=103762 RepID=A0A8J5R6H7_ZIZPA|nr:hypothetical protein GUJ93_ZPchr0207g7163 [Zizania palustris]